MNDPSDTQLLPPPMNPAPKSDRSKMTDRELLLDLHDRLDVMDERLAAGDELFQLAERRERQHEADWTVAMKFMHSLNVRLAKHDPTANAEADQIEDAIKERFPNGSASSRETPTSPNNERPSKPPPALDAE